MIAAAKNISSTETLTAAMRPIRVLMAAGGTGGHVYPAISIANAIVQKNPGADILFVGTKDRMEWTAVPKEGYPIKSIWISGFHRRLTIQNLLFPFKLIVSIVQSIIIVRRFNPDMLIACGGFAAGPSGWVAAMMGIPIILQEQNSFPGVTNRLLAKHASIIFTAFEEASNFFDHDNIRISGNPVRKELLDADKTVSLETFNFTDKKKTLLVLGGSGGAKSINDAMLSWIQKIHDDLRIQIIWQCGNKYIDQIKQNLEPEKLTNLRLLAYIDDMPAAYAVADLAISRAGAISCSELMTTETPSILIPSPHVAGDHQKKNARTMVSNGAADILEDSEIGSKLFESVKELIFDERKLAEMRKSASDLSTPDAAEKIAGDVLELYRSKENEKNLQTD
ncbi:MAG TPA: undecaprenyldiphospho-muramoylpentapeptide beta-N-acetylglucosaminyltransferase [Balneolaceae bacterium]|nr:undecaprenyldiphospho-muramoylpentapeptide beta-N-acetylglucosaminyltransferase [Balneolaceae bacterium]